MGSNSNSNTPSRLERSLSLTSEPRTLTKTQYELVWAIASMQASEKQRLAGINIITAENGVAKGKADRDEGSTAAPAKKSPA